MKRLFLVWKVLMMVAIGMFAQSSTTYNQGPCVFLQPKICILTSTFWNI